jgi:hypothetical protein
VVRRPRGGPRQAGSRLHRGIRKAYETHGKGHEGYHATALRNLNFGKWDEADYDADTADLIVQYGLFGEVVYG